METQEDYPTREKLCRRLLYICTKWSMEMEKQQKNDNKTEIFTFNFLKHEKDKWNSESTFYIRLAKGFHL